MSVETSIVIVNYLADVETERLKKSLNALKNAEVIIINNSRDNRGYGGGCNLGASQAKGKFLVFLNPDVVVSAESLNKMIMVLKTKPEIGLVGPQIIRPDGRVEISCSAIPSPVMTVIEYSFLRNWPIFRRTSDFYRLDGFDHKHSRYVPAVGGSCLVVRKSDFDKVDGFDKNLFLYFEEFDLSKRLFDQLGLRTYFCAEASMVHTGQVSTNKLSNPSTIFKQSRRYWLSKTYGWQGKLSASFLEMVERLRG